LLEYNIPAVFVGRNSLYFILQNQDGSGVVCYHSMAFNCLQSNLEMCLYCGILWGFLEYKYKKKIKKIKKNNNTQIETNQNTKNTTPP
jgi:hypothetical protein